MLDSYIVASVARNWVTAAEKKVRSLLLVEDDTDAGSEPTKFNEPEEEDCVRAVNVWLFTSSPCHSGF